MRKYNSGFIPISICLMADAADGGGLLGASAGTDVELLQHLANVDLTTIDRSRTILKDGQYPMRVVSMEPKKVEPSQKNPKGGHRLQIGLSLMSPTKDEDGKDIDLEKFVYYTNVSLTPTEKYNPLERLADIQLACFGAQRKGFNIPDYLGQSVVLKVKVEDSVEYGKQNRERWVPKKGNGPVGTASAAPAVGSL